MRFMKKNEKRYQKLLQEAVTKSNGWYATEDFQLTLIRERSRINRNGGQASYIFIDFSNHYQSEGLIYDASYYEFLRHFLKIINANTRLDDTKCITFDYKISILLIDTSLDKAQKFIEKLSAKLSDYMIRNGNQEQINLAKSLVMTAMRLNAIDEASRPGNTGEDVRELPFANVANGFVNMDPLSPEAQRSNMQIGSDGKTDISEITIISRHNQHQYAAQNQNNGHQNSDFTLANGKGDGGSQEAPHASSPAKSQMNVINGGAYNFTSILNGGNTRFTPEADTTENKSKTVLNETDNFYFNWNIFSLSFAPRRLKPPLEFIVAKDSPHPGYFFIKRLMDICFSFFGLIVLMPMLALLAFLVKVTSKGPAFFKQKRIGYRGKVFTFLKFRSMKEDNDNGIHKAYMEKLIAGETDQINNGTDDNPVYKIADDPRITKVGKFLRKTSLDEIPQLLNVLKGDMSMVGPRPPISYEVDAYKTWHLRRITEVHPGVTGMWQVYGRNKTTFDEMVRLDLQYVRERSIMLDLKLIIKTILMIFDPKSGL